MLRKIKEKLLEIGLGIVLVLSLASFLYFRPMIFQKGEAFLENHVYDLRVRKEFKPVSKDTPIAIIDIDDRSLKKEGRWPWPRKKIANLIDKLFAEGVSVIASDISFDEPEANIADEILSELGKQQKTLPELEEIRHVFNYDELLAKSLQKGATVLSFFFEMEGVSSGQLPPPILTLSPALSQELLIPNYPFYTSNIETLEQAAHGGGFINASPDSDGIERFAPLLLRNKEQLYPSLGLEAARLFLFVKQPQLVTATYGKSTLLEGILFDNQFIPTDLWGRILIPFRGPSYSIPYISATDVLNDAVSPKSLAGKLVFIGSSATALGDLVATAISPVFPGVEIQADIASGIIENYLPYKPIWGKGVAFAMVLFLGTICAVAFPLIGLIGSSIVAFFLSFGVIQFNRWVWVNHKIVLSFLFPSLIIWVLYLLNLIWGDVSEQRKRRKTIAVFGQYVPPERIDTIMETKEDLSLEGETKELTVLFTDIRSFTSMSESMTAQELKQFLNRYLTQMTQIIFDHKGTIDKYVGDMIMAFWGAPLEDPQNALDAIRTGLAMQKKLAEFDIELRTSGLPEIRIGVGINTGMMNVGDMGSQFRRAYTVLGDSVNLASRLESICRYYDVQVIVGEETYRHAKDAFGWRKLDRVQVKGKKQAVEIYEPVCLLDQCPPEVLELLELHRQAMEAYFKQDWEAAEQLFEKLKALDPKSQILYGIYLERIAKFRASPPEHDWNGVFILDTK